ncbi:hypothetical protein [Egbenema bharatensis]
MFLVHYVYSDRWWAVLNLSINRSIATTASAFRLPSTLLSLYDSLFL